MSPYHQGFGQARFWRTRQDATGVRLSVTRGLGEQGNRYLSLPSPLHRVAYPCVQRPCCVDTSILLSSFSPAHLGIRMMRIPLAFVTVLALFSTSIAAQVVVTGGGCGINGRSPSAPVANGAPTVGNASFAISHTPPSSAVVSFALFGSSMVAPFPDFPILPMPCTAPCGQAVNLSGGFVLMGRDLIPAGSTATYGIPIPNWPTLVGTALSLQMLNFSPTGCAEISQGIEFTIQ